MKFVLKQSLMFLFLLFLITSKPLSTSLNPAKTYDQTTKATNWSNGSVFSLTELNVDCKEKKILKGFHLIRPTTETIAYEFACISNSLISNETYEKHTGWNDTGDEFSSTNHIDRHSVDCGNDMIQQFQLVRNEKKIAYKYRCVKVNTNNECKYKENVPTFANVDGQLHNIYLDKQHVLAEDNYGFTQFKLRTFYKKDIQKNCEYSYEYRICKLQRPIVRPEPGDVNSGPGANESSGKNIPSSGNVSPQTSPEKGNIDNPSFPSASQALKSDQKTGKLRK